MWATANLRMVWPVERMKGLKAHRSPVSALLIVAGLSRKKWSSLSRGKQIAGLGAGMLKAQFYSGPET